MRVTLAAGPFGTYRLLSGTNEDLFLQSDSDFPRVVSMFGWVPCHCRDTDGTIDCQHRTAVDMIADARRYLDEHLGVTVDDPGYF